jgi:hypothetical protein
VAICAEIAHPQHAKEAAAQGVNIYASCFIPPSGYVYDTSLMQAYSRDTEWSRSWQTMVRQAVTGNPRAAARFGPAVERESRSHPRRVKLLSSRNSRCTEVLPRSHYPVIFLDAAVALLGRKTRARTLGTKSNNASVSTRSRRIL